MGNDITNGFTKGDDLIFESYVFSVSLLSDDTHPFGGTKFRYVCPLSVEIWVKKSTLFKDSETPGGNLMGYV